MARFKAFMLVGVLAAAGSVPALADAVRFVQPLARDWQFQDGDLGGADRRDQTTANWQAVQIPHSWNRVGHYRHDGEGSGTNRVATINKRQGIGWYRIDFTPAANLAGRRNWLEFDGASRVAKIWLNGTYLGEHRGGFSRFRFDASTVMRPGAGNQLLVQVDNSQPKAGGTTADVLPLTGDFFVHGGLYRPVRLVSVAPLHIDLADAGGSGIYASTKSATKAAASVAVRVKLANDAGTAGAARLRIALIDSAGRVAAQSNTAVSLAANATGTFAAELNVPSPRLWQGVNDPHLYVLAVSLIAADGKVIDSLEQNFGIRTMRFDPARGLLLNGQSYRLRGVGYHQDRDGKGWAINRADIEEDVAMLREMGVNSIRLTHYQHGQDIHDIADRTGIVLWDEIPLVSAWTLGGKLEPDPALVGNARQQLTELIAQNYNHAASAMWSIANEVDFGNSLPIFLTGNMGDKQPDPMPLLKELNTLARTLDPSRPTTLATCCEGRLFAPDVTVPTTAVAADLGGANRYFGWYYGAVEELGPHLDALQAQRPNQPLSLTEYGAGGALTIHTDNVLGGQVDSRGRAQPEEYESHIHEQTLPQIEARRYLFASWLWNSFDFATTVRNEGDAQDINTKGLIAYDHQTRKDAYYFYKANWTTAPTVHITGRRYVQRAYAVTDVRVYSNLDATELLLNGRSLGIRRNCTGRVCIWPQVRLATGANALLARGRSAAGTAQDAVQWTLSAEKQNEVVIDTGTMVAGKGDGRTLGSDNWFEGGTVASLDKPADFGKPPVLTAIADTAERDAVATYRTGRFSYRIPAPAGRYVLKLTFAATGDAGGSFNVTAGSQSLLKDYRPPAPSTGTAAVTESFDVQSNGEVRLDFTPGTADARVSLIELVARR